MSEYILRVKNIKKSFGGVKALKGVDLEIKKGEIHCLAGENGCGKSTLIKIVSGFFKQDEGTIEIDGETFANITTSESIRRGIQVIYQDLSVFPKLTVMENLALSMELMNGRKLVNRKRMQKIAEQAVEMIDYHVDFQALVRDLSLGDRQMIAICRSLLYDAKLIIMDEPTSSLTKKEVKELFKVIRRLQSQGIAVLFVSHKLDEVFEISERFTIFRNGENVISADTEELDREKFTYYMTGRNFENHYFESEASEEIPVLQVKNLGITGMFEDISFEVRRGEIFGVTGLLGCGRDEIMLSLFGMIPSERGQILIDGVPCRIDSVSAAKAKGIGYVPADRITEGLFLPLAIRDNIIAAELKAVTGKAGLVDQKCVEETAEHWISEMSVVARDSGAPVQTLSGGNQQKIVLARWMATELSVLILNGPTVGVDIGAKHDI